MAMKFIRCSLWLAALGLMAACNKKSDDPTPSETPTGTLMFHLHTTLQGLEVNAYNDYETTDGRDLKLTSAQLFISNIQAEKLDGTLVTVAGTVLLKEIDTEVYTVGDIPVGNYQSVRFLVGLDSATNALTPASGSVLNTSSMWLGANAQPDGYVFVNFQGTIDTTSTLPSAANAVLQPFSYKIGTKANARQVVMPQKNFTIVKDQIQYVHMNVDYYQLFNGIEINVAGNLSVVSTADNAGDLAKKMADNIPSMFGYEE